jgi:hypothetical protein
MKKEQFLTIISNSRIHVRETRVEGVRAWSEDEVVVERVDGLVVCACGEVEV